jgi:hypothetical protein
VAQFYPAVLFWHWLVNYFLKKTQLNIDRKIQAITLISALVIFCWLSFSNVTLHWILLLPLMQLSLLTLIMLRTHSVSGGNTMSEEKTLNQPKHRLEKLMNVVLSEWVPSTKEYARMEIASREQYFFMAFTCLCIFAIGCYGCLLSSMELSRQLSPMPILLLGFGLLLGAGNILSMLSFKLKINFDFVVISAIILAGYFRETHWVGLIHNEKQPVHTERPSLRPYFNKWMAARNDALSSADSLFPVYLVMSDGGASRSAYWTASVLSKLDSLKGGKLYQQMFSLSGSSGGSLGNLAFVAAQKVPQAERSNTLQNTFQQIF